MKLLQKLMLLWKPVRGFLPWALLGAILLVAFWIRIQGVPNIPEGQFTGNDPYLHYWTACVQESKTPVRSAKAAKTRFGFK